MKHDYGVLCTLSLNNLYIILNLTADFEVTSDKN